MQSYRVGFIFSYVLGHVVHQKNLEPYVRADTSIVPSWMLIPSRAGDVWDRVPLIKDHMPLRMSLRARVAMRITLRSTPLDVLFYHTQITALMGLRRARRIPTVLSLDATPIDFARLGGYHARSEPRKSDRSGLKFRWNRNVFRRAAALIAWSQWCKRSLVEDYGVDPARVSVIPPGVNLSQWEPVPKSPHAGRKLRLLFVGGDFKRKGGHVLLEAFRWGLSDRYELDIVSGESLIGQAGVRMHGALQCNSPELRRLYDQADIFVFPSRADCMSMVAMEAMASGLPVISTHVGGVQEYVENGRNGLVIPPDDPGALIAAIKAMGTDPQRREAMGRAGRERAERVFDASMNYQAVLALLKGVAEAGQEVL